MADIPKFALYEENDPQIEETLQPRHGLRNWSDLENEEKHTALRHIINSGWLKNTSQEVLKTIEYLNYKFYRQCPGKRLHGIIPERNVRHSRLTSSTRPGRPG